jgi:hypothetical protein
MNNSSRNRNHPDHQNELQVLKTDLCNQVITDIQQVVSLYAHLFDLDFLSSRKPNVPIQQALATLYQRTLKAFQQHNIPFDDHLVSRPAQLVKIN